MALTDLERRLRRTTVLTSIPGFGLALAGSIISNGVIIGLGILPLVCSSLIGGIHLSHRGSNLALRKPGYFAFADLLIGCVFLSILISFWAIEPGRMYRRPDDLMVETYASTIFMVDTGIHFYMFIRQAYLAQLVGNLFQCRECEECARKARSRTTQRTQNGAHYNLLNPEESEYRDSMDTVAADEPEDPQGKLNIEVTEESNPSNPRGEEEAMLAQV